MHISIIFIKFAKHVMNMCPTHHTYNHINSWEHLR